MNILGVQKSSTKHHKTLFYSLAIIQYVVCLAGVNLRERSLLTHMLLFFFREKLMYLHTAYLKSDHSRHQWVFFQFIRKTTQSQHIGEVTLNWQALAPM
jgi:hypothetical protein